MNFIPFFLIVVALTAPIFVTTPSSQSVLFQEQAQFNCIIMGEPQPIITWYKNRETITGETLPSLTFGSVEPSDRGVYSCSASNSEGTITSDGAVLRITSQLCCLIVIP